MFTVGTLKTKESNNLDRLEFKFFEIKIYLYLSKILNLLLISIDRLNNSIFNRNRDLHFFNKIVSHSDITETIH